MWLLDTNIVSELVKRVPDANVHSRFETMPQDQLAISAVTIFELRFGAARAPHPAKMWGRIESRILPRCQVVPLQSENALAAADLLATLTPIKAAECPAEAVALLRTIPGFGPP